MYDIDAEKVNTLIRPDGEKKAYVRLKADHDALGVANRIVYQSTTMDKTVFEQIKKDYEHYVSDHIDAIPAETRIFLFVVSCIIIILLTIIRAFKSLINPNREHLTHQTQQYYLMIKQRRDFMLTAITSICVLNLLNAVVPDTILPNPFGLLLSVIFGIVIE
ncbi:unnamed protein product, partial [Rotaria sordida]